MDVWRFLAAIVFGPISAIGALSVAATLWPAQPADGQPVTPENRFDTVPVTWSAENICVVGRIFVSAEPDDDPAYLVHGVHAGPDRGYATIDTVRHGEFAARCEERASEGDDLGWAGIIYGGSLDECDLTDPPGSPRPYAGQCRYGWVEAENFRAGVEPRIAGR